MKATFYNSTETLIAFTNEIAIGEDGWAQIAPFGDFPGMALIADGKGGYKKEAAIQRMDKTAVAQMVNEYQRTRKGLTRFVTSRPIFLGHPDSPGAMGAKYPDKHPKGVFANIACRDNGFFGEPILTEEGEQLIASRKVTALSGRWDAEFVAKENGVNIYRPVRFLSAGLTDRPNLPVQLLNEAEAETNNQTKTNTMKKELLIALLASLGIMNKGAAFVNEASDEDVSEGLNQLGEKAKTATTLANEKATLVNEKATLEGKVTTLTLEKTTATTERDNAKTSFANERKARIGELLDGSIKGGFITAAERATWEARLGNEANFANEAAALKALTPGMKTKSLTLSRGDRKVEISNASERREMVAELVNERMTTAKCDYDAAFAHVEKNYPQLFEAMTQPDLKGRKQ